MQSNPCYEPIDVAVLGSFHLKRAVIIPTGCYVLLSLICRPPVKFLFAIDNLDMKSMWTGPHLDETICGSETFKTSLWMRRKRTLDQKRDALDLGCSKGETWAKCLMVHKEMEVEVNGFLVNPPFTPYAYAQKVTIGSWIPWYQKSGKEIWIEYP